MRWLFVTLLIAACGGTPPAEARAAELPPPPDDLAQKVQLEVFLTGLDEPLALVAAPGDPSGRLFLVEKGGRVRIVRDGQLARAPFLDLSDRVSSGSEQGLLGLAFHPKYAENGRFYVNFTDRKGDTRVVELRVAAGDPDRADPATERELLFVDQPYANHNGGHLVFGPDGRLYVGLGDGGSAGDPKGNAQDPKRLLGKMLRLDVDAAAPSPEVWQLGLRNPWRYAFDPKTRDLYIADVGQSDWEEVNVVPFAAAAGANFGWDAVEGMGHCFEPQRGCRPDRFVAPVVEYDHRTGCSITGGAVYRGHALPELDGIYFYSDYCTGILRGFRFRDGKVEDHWDWKAALDPREQLARVSSFGEDAAGELYILSLDGTVYRVAPR